MAAHDADRLDAYLDALSRGLKGPANDLDANTAEVSQRLLHARIADPSPGFLARLEHTLVEQWAGKVARDGATFQTPLDPSPTNAVVTQPKEVSVSIDISTRSRKVPSPPQKGRSRFGRLLEFAALLVLGVGLIAAFVPDRLSNDQPPPTLDAIDLNSLLNGGTSGTSLDANTVLSTSACDVPPRPQRDFTERGDERDKQASSQTLYVPPDLNQAGIPVDASVLRLLERTMSEIVTCRNALDVARHYALFTDEALERILEYSAAHGSHDMAANLVASIDTFAASVGTPMAASPGNTWSMNAINAAELLPSGRIRATFVFGTADGPLEMTVFFAAAGTEWRLDDASYWTYDLE